MNLKYIKNFMELFFNKLKKSKKENIIMHFAIKVNSTNLNKNKD